MAAEAGSLAAVKKHLARDGVGFGIASRAAIQRDLSENLLAAVPPIRRSIPRSR